jgi:hypothetical protein
MGAMASHGSPHIQYEGVAAKRFEKRVVQGEAALYGSVRM